MATPLPPTFRSALVDYERHLRSVRGLSPHSVRAYLADATSLLDHAARMGRDQVAVLDLPVLRSWLARLSASRAGPVQHGATGGRGPQLHRLGRRDGLADADAGALLATPKAVRHLPGSAPPGRGRRPARRRRRRRRRRQRDRPARRGHAGGALRQRHPGRRAVRPRPRRRRPRPPAAAGRRQGRQGAGRAARAARPCVPSTPGSLGGGRSWRAAAAARRCSSGPGVAGSTRGPSGGPCTTCSRTCRGPLTWARTASAIRLQPTYWKVEPT